MKTIFDLCQPRKDVLSGHLTESDFAADLAQVIDQRAPDEYQKPEVFFANTHPTKGLKAAGGPGRPRPGQGYPGG